MSDDRWPLTLAVSGTLGHDASVLTQRVYESQVVRLTDLATTEDVLTDFVFLNCVIMGPAVAVVMGTTSITNSVYITPDTNAMFWLIPPDRKQIIGGIALINCLFDGCRFERVGFAGNEALRAAIDGAPNANELS